MFQELLSIAVTREPSNLTMFLEVAAVIAVVGLVLWLVGARFSRQIVTLCGVAAGAMVGKHLPEIFPATSNLSAPVLAVGGALVFGVVTFLTHRLWIGLMLGVVLATWASFGTWVTQHGQQSWSQPVWDADITLRGFGEQLWTALPPDVTRIMPFAAGAAMLSGLALALLWPRIATALNWSLTGATILLCVALTGMAYAKAEWLGALPANTWAQAGIFAGIVLFGALVQWKLAPKGAVKKKAAPAPPTV
jgi:hypothetical protein